MAKAVELAHEAGHPGHRLRPPDPRRDLDLYVSFDNVQVGELQARVPGRPPATAARARSCASTARKTDNNAKLFKAGQDNVLKPYIERGDIEVVHEDWAEDWKPENAKKIVNAAITAHGGDFDAVLARNDGTAGGAIQALTEEGLAGKVLVTGQDAELVACSASRPARRAMTIYKPLQDARAQRAAELRCSSRSARSSSRARSVNNGKIDVPAILLATSSPSTRRTSTTTVIKDGFHSTTRSIAASRSACGHASQ